MQLPCGCVGCYAYHPYSPVFSLATGLIAEIFLVLFFVCNAVYCSSFVILCNGRSIAENKV